MESPLGFSFEETGSQSCFNVELNIEPSHLKVCNKDQRSTSYKIKKTRDFDKMYLKYGLWPDKVSSNVRQDYYKCQQKILRMRSERNKENPCSSCKKYRDQLDSTKLALNHALDLSTTLIKQISLNNE